MAEEVKKDDKKEEKKDTAPAAEQSLSEVAEKIILSIIGLTLLYRAFDQIRTGGVHSIFFLDRFKFLEPIWHKLALTYTVLATILSLFLFVGIIYCLIKILEVENKWYEKLYPKPSEEVVVEKTNTRWNQILEHIQSGNPSDWRLSILECDIILGDLLDTQGYRGDTIGDKLKSAERSPFKTLNAAWEAHRIRNAIAHEGQDFILTQREARRVIGLYESVFKEFDYI